MLGLDDTDARARDSSADAPSSSGETVATSGGSDGLDRSSPRDSAARAAAGLVVAGVVCGVLFSGYAAGTLVLGVPLLMGAVLPLIRAASLTENAERFEPWLSQRANIVSSKTGKFSRFFVRPLLAGLLGIWRRTAGLEDPHVRAGVRVGAGLLFVGVMLAALAIVGYVLVIVVVAVGMILFMLWALAKGLQSATGGSGGEARTEQAPEPAPARMRGTRLVKEGLFGDTATGTAVDRDGRIVSEGLFGDSPSGLRIDADGRLVREGLFGDMRTGTRVLEDGRVVSEGILGDTPTGIRVDSEGRVVKEGILGDTPTEDRFEKK